MGYYIYANQGRQHAVSMRYIGQQGYLFDKMDQAGSFKDISAHVIRAARMYILQRTSYLAGVMTFCIYICPLIVMNWNWVDKQYRYTENVWLIGILLTWSRQISEQLSKFMKTVSKVFIFAEIGERLVEMQNECSVKQLRMFDGDLDEIRDELTDADLVKIFNKRYVTDEFNYVRDKELPVIKIENLNHSQQRRLLLTDINLNVYYEDKIALIQKDGTSAIDSLLDIIMGFTKPQSSSNRQADQEFASKVEVYGKRVETLPKHHLRKYLCYLNENPPLFLGTLRDIIDPAPSMAEELIVKVLHFLGFFKEFCIYIDKTEIRDVRLHLIMMEILSQKEAYFTNKVTNEIEAKIWEERKRSTTLHITGKKSKDFENRREKNDTKENDGKFDEQISTDKTKKLVSKIKTEDKIYKCY